MGNQKSEGFRKLLRASFAKVFIPVSVLSLQACSGLVSHSPAPEQTGYIESGIASYYAKKFHGRKTASGERLNNNSMTAAHRTLPFGTEVIVKNINTGKSVKVIINDRGPFIKGRIIDLTRAAFSQIASLDKGVVRVEISAMK